MGLTLMLIIFFVGVAIAAVMFYRTAAKGKREDTSPGRIAPESAGANRA